MARAFCCAMPVRKVTKSTASSGFLEYFETARFQPPSVPVWLPFEPCPFGSATTPTRSLMELSSLCASAQA